MELQPKRQPGRADRKAAAYALEIARLRSMGYTYEAIREAMAEVGVELSTSALRREVRRLHGRSNVAVQVPLPVPLKMPLPGLPPATARTVSAAPPSSSVPPLSPASPAAAPASRGHEVAEAFFNAHPSNPLVPTKELP